MNNKNGRSNASSAGSRSIGIGYSVTSTGTGTAGVKPNAAAGAKAKEKTKKLGQDFICATIYTNKLPPGPFEPKLVAADKLSWRRANAQFAFEHYAANPTPATSANPSFGSSASPTLLLPQSQVQSATTTTATTTAATIDSFTDIDTTGLGALPVHPVIPHTAATALRLALDPPPAIPNTNNANNTAANAKPPPLHPKDQALLRPYAPPSINASTNATSAARPIAAWLRRTEYIAHDSIPTVSASAAAISAATAAGASKQAKSKSFHPKQLQQRHTRQELVASIDRSFDAAAAAFIATIKHPSNPSLSATELLPVFPEFERVAYPYFSLVYDADPVANDEKKEESSTASSYNSNADVARSAALLKVFSPPSDDNNELGASATGAPILAFYAPSQPAIHAILERRRRIDEEEDDDDEDIVYDEEENPVLDFVHVKDFNYKLKHFSNGAGPLTDDSDDFLLHQGAALGPGGSGSGSGGQMIFLSVSDEVASYHSLRGRFDLVRTRAQSKNNRGRYTQEDSAALAFEKAKPTIYQTVKRSRNPHEVYAKRKAMHKVLPLDVEQPEAPPPPSPSSSPPLPKQSNIAASVGNNDDADLDDEISRAVAAGDEDEDGRGTKKIKVTSFDGNGSGRRRDYGNDSLSDSDRDSRGNRDEQRSDAGNAMNGGVVVDEDGDAEW
ncbi:hypothetical protein HK100_011137 [Physocladia obscura]|uniref:Uncharacterized protein n=1 Tax=Physocladia obscura TaxID=109957 RepID=A0AAD5T7P0_9FUNG|nr:hypothetical protein HK100_011137 [Physocladia obscura]